MNIKNTEEIIDKISLVVSNWSHYAKAVHVDADLMDSIGKTHIIL
jgi:hypothetical protein